MPDPYADILGLPPHMRPPTYYQLLEIACTEMSAEVIKIAATRQLDRLRVQAKDELAEECRQLAREIKQACRTLLDPAARQRYDLLSPDAKEPWYALTPVPAPSPSAPVVGGTDFWDEIDREEEASPAVEPPPAAPLPDWLKGRAQ